MAYAANTASATLNIAGSMMPNTCTLGQGGQYTIDFGQVSETEFDNPLISKPMIPLNLNLTCPQLVTLSGLTFGTTSQKPNVLIEGNSGAFGTDHAKVGVMITKGTSSELGIPVTTIFAPGVNVLSAVPRDTRSTHAPNTTIPLALNVALHHVGVGAVDTGTGDFLLNINIAVAY